MSGDIISSSIHASLYGESVVKRSGNDQTRSKGLPVVLGDHSLRVQSTSQQPEIETPKQLRSILKNAAEKPLLRRTIEHKSPKSETRPGCPPQSCFEIIKVIAKAQTCGREVTVNNNGEIVLLSRVAALVDSLRAIFGWPKMQASRNMDVLEAFSTAFNRDWHADGEITRASSGTDVTLKLREVCQPYYEKGELPPADKMTEAINLGVEKFAELHNSPFFPLPDVYTGIKEECPKIDPEDPGIPDEAVSLPQETNFKCADGTTITLRQHGVWLAGARSHAQRTAWDVLPTKGEKYIPGDYNDLHEELEADDPACDDGLVKADGPACDDGLVKADDPASDDGLVKADDPASDDGLVEAHDPAKDKILDKIEALRKERIHSDYRLFPNGREYEAIKKYAKTQEVGRGAGHRYPRLSGKFIYVGQDAKPVEKWSDDLLNDSEDHFKAYRKMLVEAVNEDFFIENSPGDIYLRCLEKLATFKSEELQDFELGNAEKIALEEYRRLRGNRLSLAGSWSDTAG